jgi:hypothetical protein
MEKATAILEQVHNFPLFLIQLNYFGSRVLEHPQRTVAETARPIPPE